MHRYNSLFFIAVAFLVSSPLTGCGGGQDSNTVVDTPAQPAPQPEPPEAADPPEAPLELAVTEQGVTDEGYIATLSWSSDLPAAEFIVSVEGEGSNNTWTATTESKRIQTESLPEGRYDWTVEVKDPDSGLATLSLQQDFEVGSQLGAEEIDWDPLTTSLDSHRFLPLDDGGTLLLVTLTDNQSNDHYALVQRLDSAGKSLWIQSFESLAPVSGRSFAFSDMITTASGLIVVQGNVESDIKDKSIVVALNTDGTIAWHSTAPGEQFPDFGLQALAALDTHIYLAGIDYVEITETEEVEGDYYEVLRIVSLNELGEAFRSVFFAVIGEDGVGPYPTVENLRMTSATTAEVAVSFDHSFNIPGDCNFYDEDNDGIVYFAGCEWTDVLTLSLPDTVASEINIYRKGERLPADLAEPDLLAMKQNVVKVGEQFVRLDYDYDGEASVRGEQTVIEDYETDIDWQAVEAAQFGLYYLEVCTSTLTCERFYLDYTSLPAGFWYKPQDELRHTSPRIPELSATSDGQLVTTLGVYLPYEKEDDDRRPYFKQVDVALVSISPEGVISLR